jgi:hypothetical protein
MNLDPNWFYSSLAQCAAAIVGLLGAILATRLQEQRTNVNSTHNEVSLKLRRLRDELQHRLHDVTTHVVFLMERLSQMEEALERGTSELNVSQEIDFWGGKHAISSMLISSDSVNEFRKRLVNTEATVKLLEKAANLNAFEELRHVTAAIEAIETLSSVHSDGPVRNWRNSIKEVVADNARHLEKAAIAIPTAITAILFWLSIVGVVAPLVYLSAYGHSSKYLLLVGFSLGVLAIPIYIGFELWRINQLKTIRLDIVSLTDSSKHPE